MQLQLQLPLHQEAVTDGHLAASVSPTQVSDGDVSPDWRLLTEEQNPPDLVARGSSAPDFVAPEGKALSDSDSDADSTNQ